MKQNTSLQLMRRRFGFLDDPKKHEHNELVADQERRLGAEGGYVQQHRMIFDKKRSLDRALRYSYQGADVVHAGSCGEKSVRALINPNRLKEDYDEKIISIPYEFGYKEGDVFEWLGTNTYWLIYLHNIEEYAYFRGNIRKCSYKISIVTENKEVKEVYAAIRGPVETAINSIYKAGDTVDIPNYSLDFLVPKTEENLKFFERYRRFYIRGINEDYEPKACWRVETVNAIGTPGIISVTAKEYYRNPDVDDIDELIADIKYPVEPVDPNPRVTEIKGETFIKPKISCTYTIEGQVEDNWDIKDLKKLPLEIIDRNNESITIKWLSLYSGQFDLTNGEYKKTIVVETLF